jgi:hypothetical protein
MVILKPSVLGIAAALGGANVHGANCRDPLMVRVISDVERPPYDSGTIAVWAKVSVLDKSNVPLELYLSYFGATQELPREGQTCSVTYEYGIVNGLVGRTGTLLRDAKIIDKMDCS